MNKRIELGKNVRFFCAPSIIIKDGGTLKIGDNVTINSDNHGYHVNMYKPCKLLIDRSGGSINIGKNTRIHGSCIHAYEEITIGENCLIAANCQIIDGNGHDLSLQNPENRIHTKGESNPIIIEDHVWIATNVVVLPGVKIGKGSVITANSVVHKNIPPGVIAGGNPIQVINNDIGNHNEM
ncbi:MAG: acyltransferase [Bacteroidota bacterium]|nr:acyltransferase [Bacteroidota bacterium]